jgi:hypothetical protein
MDTEDHMNTKTAKKTAKKTTKKTTLRPVIVRTYSAGVHFGYLLSQKGKEVRMERSRRIWKWFGAWTLSEVATVGIDKLRSKVAAPVTITLTEAIEVIDCTPEATASIEGATWAV